MSPPIRPFRIALPVALALAFVMEMAPAAPVSALDRPGGLPAGPRTIDYPYTTTSIYEHSANATTLYNQGCAAGKVLANGVIILDFGRPAYRRRRYGSIDFSGHFLSNPSILTAMESFGHGYRHCLPAGRYPRVNIARGTNNSCSNQDPRCCPRGCPLQPPSFTKAGTNWALYTRQLAGYMHDHHWSRWERTSAADDAEPAWDPAFTHTRDFLSAYANVVGTTHAMWDYGSLESGYWSARQEYAVAYGYPPDVPFPEIYYSGNASQWEALDLWSVANEGHPMKIWGVMTQYNEGHSCGYNSHQAYRTMLGRLQSHTSTSQSSIPYLSNIPCYTSIWGEPGAPAVWGSGSLGTQAEFGGIPVPFSPAVFRTTNLWQGQVGGDGVFVYAGSLPATGRGALMVTRIQGSTGMTVGGGTFEAPSGAGPLWIIGVSGGIVTLRAGRSVLSFDLARQVFLQGAGLYSVVVSPTGHATPVPPRPQ